MRILLTILLAAAVAQAQEWSRETLDLFARMPVQDGGRVKPLSTVASFALLRMNHQRAFRDAEGKSHDPMSWMLEALFRPEEARKRRVFLVENADVLDAIGVSHEGRKRRDRYSYDELFPARSALLARSQEYAHLDPKKRNPVQAQMVPLGQNFLEFEGYLRFFEWARAGDTMRKFAEGELGAQEVVRRFDAAYAIALLPPTDRSPEWYTPRDVAELIVAGMAPAKEHVEMLARLEALVASGGDPKAFENNAREFLAQSSRIADTRGEYRKIGLEVSFYRLDPFHKSLIAYLFAFLLVAAGWAWPNKWLARAALVVGVGSLTMQTAGIVMRCILRGRPPVSTLYETVLFVTGVAALASYLMEAIHRRRIGLAAAPILGAIGLFVANRYEAIDGKDTMPQLVAVLDTNFWLATHVTCITIGYAAGLLAAALAHVYLLGDIFRLKRGDTSFYRGITRMVYGVTCFSLAFSTVGTILGGVWANDSWGRFWGWDPKENGALLIVLSQLALLHGRMGGYIREYGTSAAAIVVGIVVSISWWGVNLLGIGLHSYGFTGGIFKGLLTFWGIELAVLGASGVVRLIRSKMTPGDGPAGPV
jgi:ABC-type transport system involved in cytochrome c biogenesis permease subunit